VRSVSVPHDAAEEFERIAAIEGRSTSELFHEMLRVYRAYRETGRFTSLQRYGIARARQFGVHDERDVERLIAEARRGLDA
jgi:metal-responsive CopG/Arc/MetJ family transcriptional regulator